MVRRLEFISVFTPHVTLTVNLLSNDMTLLCISGGTPYPTLTNRELCQLLKTGYRMERPDMCCDEA